jgi:hypothetical protein
MTPHQNDPMTEARRDGVDESGFDRFSPRSVIVELDANVLPQLAQVSSIPFPPESNTRRSTIVCQSSLKRNSHGDFRSHGGFIVTAPLRT